MNNTPQKTPNRTPQNGQRPTQGQPRPPQNGQRPMQGQPRPAQNGQRPMQGQARPQSKKASTAIPILGSLSTVLGSLSFVQTVIIMVLLILITVLVVASTVLGIITLSNNGFFDKIGEFFDKDTHIEVDNDKDKGDKPSKDTQKVDENDPTIVSSSITLPTSTPTGSYLSGYATDAKTIEGISSAAAVLVDVSSNSVTASKAADTRIYPASMTKIMTLLVACENATTAGKLLTVEQWMIDYQQKMGASGIMGFKAGEQVRLEDALYLINYNSDTIACLLVANHVAGSEAKFVELMNKKAQSLGLTSTHFTNTTGLYDANHYTTCREMAAIMNCAMKNPVASKIITAHSGRGVTVYTGNKVSRSATIYAAWYSDSGRFNDDARVTGTNGNMTVIGGKTGYEDIPTACFVTIAENKNGSRYICVTVGRTSETQAGISTTQSTTDTETIYREYAYKK